MPKSIIPSARKIVVAIALTVAAGVFLAAVGMFVFPQSLRLQSRTIQERQFRTGAEWWETDLSTIREFEKRHGLNPEAIGGLRLAIDEWPDWRYLISLEISGDGSAKGAIRAITYDDKGPVYERNFQLEKYEARLFFASFDEEIDGYWGSTTECLDGTSFQFERWSEKAVTSGVGNAACQRHYAELMSLVAETLFTPLKDVPFDWRSWFSAKRYLKLPHDGS